MAFTAVAVTTPIKVSATNTKPTLAVRDHASEESHPTATVTNIPASITNTLAHAIGPKQPSDLQTRVPVSDHLITSVIMLLVVPVTSTVVSVTNTKPTSAVQDYASAKNHPTATVTNICASITNTLAHAIRPKQPSDLQTRVPVSDHLTISVITLLVPITSTLVAATNIKPTLEVLGHAFMEENRPTATVTNISASITNTLAHATSTERPSNLQTRVQVSDHPTISVITLLVVPVTSTVVYATNTKPTLAVQDHALEQNHWMATVTNNCVSITYTLAHATSTERPSHLPSHVLVSDHLITSSVITLLAPGTNTLNFVTNAGSTSVYQVFVVGKEGMANIAIMTAITEIPILTQLSFFHFS